MPGTQRLTSGVRTTYAVVIVPEETTALIFETKGCYFPRSSSQLENYDANWEGSGTNRGCSASKKLLVPLPNGGNPFSNSFTVGTITYRSVPKGGKAVVSIGGENFSSQIGILVDGIALSPSIGLGQPFIRDDSEVGKAVGTDIANSRIKGTFERISSREIIATFEMGGDYQGTPVITLVSPGTSLTLNSYKDIKVFSNDKNINNLIAADYIFGRKIGSETNETIIDTVDVFQENQENLRILVKGRNLTETTEIYINGLRFEKCQNGTTDNCFSSDANGYLISVPFSTAPQIRTIKLTLLTKTGTLDSSATTNPAFDESKKGEPVLAKYEVKKSDFAITNFIQKGCTQKDNKNIVVFEITGTGLSKDAKTYIKNKEQNTSFEDSKIFLIIESPDLTQTVLFQNPKLQRQDEKIILFDPKQCNKD